jgi:hypothetical protein
MTKARKKIFCVIFFLFFFSIVAFSEASIDEKHERNNNNKNDNNNDFDGEEFFFATSASPASNRGRYQNNNLNSMKKKIGDDGLLADFLTRFFDGRNRFKSKIEFQNFQSFEDFLFHEGSRPSGGDLGEKDDRGRIRISVPLNVAFLGFENDGRYNVSIQSEELARWLERLNREVSHEYADVGIGGGNNRVKSKVVYDVRTRALNLGSSVLSVFEDLIERHSREVHRLHGLINMIDSRVVDAYAIERVIDDLAEFLGIEDEHFLIVANTKTPEDSDGDEQSRLTRDERIARYGYRYGLTDEEVVILRDDEEVSKKASSFMKSAIEWRRQTLRSGELKYDHDGLTSYLFSGSNSGRRRTKKSIVKTKSQSKIAEQLRTLLLRDGFYNNDNEDGGDDERSMYDKIDENEEIEEDLETLGVYTEKMNSLEEKKQKVKTLHDLKTFGDLWAARQHISSSSSSSSSSTTTTRIKRTTKVVDDVTLKKFALEILNGDDEIAATRIARQIAKNEQGHEGCLTESIISSKTKTAFLDLSAGPFSWGELERMTKKVIGHGAHDFPNTKSRFGSGKKMTQAEFRVKRQRLVQQLDAARARRLEKSHQSRDELTSRNLAAVEIDLLERFFKEHCLHEGNQGAAKACDDAMKTKIALEHGADADFDIASFGESVRLQTLEDSQNDKDFFQTPGQFANDVFLAEVTAMIGAYASSVIAPPATMASFLKRAKPYKTIHAFLYILELGVSESDSNDSKDDGKSPNKRHESNINEYAYSDALRLEILDALDASSLKMTKVSATARIVTAVEEPAMASAFVAALRTGKVSGFGVDGKKTEYARARWLDIDALAQHLLVNTDNDEHNDDENHLEIPIFVFDQRFDGEHKDSPLLFTNAKAVEIIKDAIFVTRSNPINEYLVKSTHGRMPFSQSRNFCGNKTIEIDFADPAREVASTVAKFVSGLIAPHETSSYFSSNDNEGNPTTMESLTEASNGFAWSVGDNPLSFTTPGSCFGAIHREIAQRNIVVAQIDRVLRTYSLGVTLLEQIDVKSDGVYEASKSGEGKRLSSEIRLSKKATFRYLKRARAILSTSSSTSSTSSSLNTDEASLQASKAQKEATNFLMHVEILSDLFHAREKRKQYVFHVSSAHYSKKKENKKSSTPSATIIFSGLFRAVLWSSFALVFFYLRMKQTTNKIRQAKARWTKSALD